jgi:hypothetical protein
MEIPDDVMEERDVGNRGQEFGIPEVSLPRDPRPRQAE